MDALSCASDLPWGGEQALKLTRTLRYPVFQMHGCFCCLSFLLVYFRTCADIHASHIAVPADRGPSLAPEQVFPETKGIPLGTFAVLGGVQGARSAS